MSMQNEARRLLPSFMFMLARHGDSRRTSRDAASRKPPHSKDSLRTDSNISFRLVDSHRLNEHNHCYHWRKCLECQVNNVRETWSCYYILTVCGTCTRRAPYLPLSLSWCRYAVLLCVDSQNQNGNIFMAYLFSISSLFFASRFLCQFRHPIDLEFCASYVS